MEPEHIRFGGGATETFLNPFVAVWMIVAIVLILMLPRNKVITPLLLTFFTIPIGQVVVLGGLHFTVLRILILAGLLRRAMFRSSTSEGKYPGGFNGLDQVVVLWTIATLVVINLQWMEQAMLIKSLGDFLDGLGAYLVVRLLIPDRAAIVRTMKVFAAICVIQALFMISEQFTRINPFGYLGGISIWSTVRDGQVRSGGILGCIYAGVFGGTLIPLFAWLWSEGRSRMAAVGGLAGAATMVITSHSSTSLLALGGSLLGLGFWPMRKRMRAIRWGLSLILIGLHLVMKAPVWALIARIDLTGSSSGDHRYVLVDNCIRHFGDWWLIGYRYYNNWGWDMWDLCNQFVVVALTGGLITLIFYIAIFSRSLGAIGRARKAAEGDRRQEWLLWCFGATMFSNVVAHFGINYMAQLQMMLFPMLACVSVAAFGAQKVTVPAAASRGKLEFAAAPGAAGDYLPLGEAR